MSLFLLPRQLIFVHGLGVARGASGIEFSCLPWVWVGIVAQNLTTFPGLVRCGGAAYESFRDDRGEWHGN